MNCIKCGYELTYIERWKYYYCNHYCCNPCCPDAYTSPCKKERIEELELEMKKHLREKGVI